MKKIFFLVTCITLLGVTCSHATSLYVGGQYSSIASVVDNTTYRNEGGGSVNGSSLDGKALDYLYCVDLFTDVYVNTTYPYTNVNTTGTIHGTTINNVGEVAWLLQTYGTGGQ